MKTMHRCFIFLVVFFCIQANPATAGSNLREISLPLPPGLQKIRVLVMNSCDEVKISCSSPYEVYDASGKVVDRGASLPVVTIKPGNDGIRFGSAWIPGGALMIQSPEHGVHIGNIGAYGDTVVIRRTRKNKIEVINYIPLDNYLKGVIPFEANPLWSLEALKAQAVASRTFAVFKMVEQANEPYDVSSGVYSQVYAGKKVENPKTNEAIEQTSGEVLTYQGKIFPGYFHSTCGGRTTGAELVWRVKPIAPLKGVECKFCEKSPHYRWKIEFTPDEIKKNMAEKGGIPVQEVKSIKLGKTDPSGRVHELIIGSTWMDKTVDADAFRVWMGPEKLKSNLITYVAVRNGKYIFRGRGWGHGVGMCQYGMKYLGELGYGYREILGYYYPGSLITKLQESPEGDIL